MRGWNGEDHQEHVKGQDGQEDVIGHGHEPVGSVIDKMSVHLVAS